MSNQIEVYVRKKRQIARQYVTPPVWDGYQHHACMSKQVTEYQDVLSPEDQHALEIMDQLAADSGVSFRIYNISTSAGKLRAKLKGVTKTPTVVLNGEKIKNMTLELLKSKLHV